MAELKGKIHSLESFGSVDGPGIRYIVFLQGCAMRCKYCHNVDTRNMSERAMELSAREIIDKAVKYKPYWKDEGGITVSGGEPLLQIDFLSELFELAKQKGISTCIDTSCQPFTRNEPFFGKFKRLMESTDLLLCDIKHIDPLEHIKLTGMPNDNILDMLSYLSSIKKPIWIRHVLVPEITDRDEYLYKTRSFIDSLSNVKKVEILPYHTLGVHKWQILGEKYELEGINPPSRERIENAREILGCK